MEHVTTLSPKVEIQELLVEAARAQKSPVMAQLALVYLGQIARRAIELQDAALLSNLESLGLLVKA